MTHKIALAGALLLVTAALPASAQPPGDNSFRLRGGLFELKGDSEYWQDNQRLFNEEIEDFDASILGADLRFGIGNRLGVLVSISAYDTENTRSYRDFVDNRGNEITNTATLEVAAATAGLTLYLAPTHARVQPYLGAGGGFYSWQLAEEGEFIDFGTVGRPIFSDRFEAEGVNFGYYYQAGVEIPIGSNWSIFGEVRWHKIDDELGDDFEDFGDLDLSGRDITAGFAWNF